MRLGQLWGAWGHHHPTALELPGRAGRVLRTMWGPPQGEAYLCWFMFTYMIYGYGSIPIHTIFSGMNIHKSQLFWCEQKGYQVLTHCHMFIMPCWYFGRRRYHNPHSCSKPFPKPRDLAILGSPNNRYFHHARAFWHSIPSMVSECASLRQHEEGSQLWSGIFGAPSRVWLVNCMDLFLWTTSYIWLTRHIHMIFNMYNCITPWYVITISFRHINDCMEPAHLIVYSSCVHTCLSTSPYDGNELIMFELEPLIGQIQAIFHVGLFHNTSNNAY